MARAWRRGRRLEGASLLCVLLAGASTACTKSQTANAIIATATTVAAAAALRAATDSCWATCAYGTVCNPRTGYCEPEPGGKTVCVDTPGQPPCNVPKEVESPLGSPDREVDGCGGVCREDEECVLRHGDLSCEPKRSEPEPPAPSPK